MATSAAEIYEQHIRSLSTSQRVELLARIVNELAAAYGVAPGKRKHTLTELCGLGKEIWEGIDAQEYVNQLRDEWHEPTP